MMKKMINISIVMIITATVWLCTWIQSIDPVKEQENTVKDTYDRENMESEVSAGDEKGSPASGGETAGKDDSCPIDEKYREVLLAYAEYLQKFCEEKSQYPPIPMGLVRFDLVYIDADDIPELAIIPSDAHCNGVHICVYNDGTVVETGEFGSRGWCQFKPCGNLICSDFFNMGEGSSSLYRIEGTESVEIQTFRFWKISCDDQYMEEGYEVDGVRVSEEEFHEAWEEWNDEELTLLRYDDAVLMDGIDDLYGELCRRIFFAKKRSWAGEMLTIGSKYFVRGQTVAESMRAESLFHVEKTDQLEDSRLEEWKQAYLAYIDEDEYADDCTYSLIYVDDDDIPELVIDTGFEAGGCQILTFHEHDLDVWQSDRLNVTYIERGSLICNSDGNMGYYYDNVYAVQDGKWVYVDGGIWGDGPNGVQIDENGNYMEFFYWTGEEPWNREEYWSGEELTEEEYEARLNAIYPMEQSVYPQKYYILDEIRSVLRTGDVASAGHQYQFFTADVTWEEARRLCRERGGYLATITSQEEFERLQSQMLSEDKAHITFFVGANNKRMEGIPFGYRWLEPGTEKGYYMLELYNALFGFWLEGEPSYNGISESGKEVAEEYVVFFYRKSDGRCYINDVPNNILVTAPSYAGRVGYICEFEKH